MEEWLTWLPRVMGGALQSVSLSLLPPFALVLTVSGSSAQVKVRRGRNFGQE